MYKALPEAKEYEFNLYRHICLGVCSAGCKDIARYRQNVMHSCGGVKEEILKHNCYYSCCLPNKYWRIYKQGLNYTLFCGQHIYCALLNILYLKFGHNHEFLEAKNSLAQIWGCILKNIVVLGGLLSHKISLWSHCGVN